MAWKEAEVVTGDRECGLTTVQCGATTIAALNENRDLPDDEMIAATIEMLKASDQRDVRAAGKILEWAKRNTDPRA